MSGFTDLHVNLGHATSPQRARLDNTWHPLLEAPGTMWVGSAVSDAGLPVDTAHAGHWVLWASGSIFSYRGDVFRPLERFATDLDAGRADPGLLDAHAVVFGWEGGRRELSVWTDRMGTVHAYVGGRDGTRSVGTFLAAVAEAAGDSLDWVAITGFCGFGFYPGDRTMFDDVRILRPATHTTFDQQGRIIASERYWNWWYDPDHARSDDDFLDEFHDIWTRTVRQQLAGTHSVVPLSGGLDSRTVFAVAAPRDGTPTDPVRTFTYGYAANSVEIRISQRVAATRGHQALELVIGPYLLERLGEVADAIEGFSGLSLCRQAGVSAEIASLGDRVVGGHWGDVWFGTAGAHESPGPVDLVSAAHSKFAKRGREWLFENLCTEHLDEAPEDVLQQVLAEELDRIPDLGDPDMALKALKTEQWSFRWTLASVRAYQLAVPTLLPFYANDVVDFFLRVPSDRLPRRRLQAAYLRRHHPDLARITWQDTGMSLYERPWEPAYALARRAVAKGLRTVRRQQVIERNSDVQYLALGIGESLTHAELLQATAGFTRERQASWSLVERSRSDPGVVVGQVADSLVTLQTSLHGQHTRDTGEQLVHALSPSLRTDVPHG